MDKELIILEQIQNNPQINQRDLATIAQASLGMTNAILKRFVTKGLITVKKVNNRNILYALTPVGVEEISKRSWKYFKRTLKNVVIYQDAIDEIVTQVKKEDYKGIILLGESDFLYMIEHSCYKKNIPFKQVDNICIDGWFRILPETKDVDDDSDDDSFSLNRLILLK